MAKQTEVFVGQVKAAFDRAVAAHREAVSHARRADDELRRLEAEQADHGRASQAAAQQAGIAAELRAAAGPLTPGWLGIPLDGTAELPALGGDALGQAALRLGEAALADDVSFPALVPLLGAGHLAVNADARDPQVSGLLRSALLRLLAACPPGSLRVLTVDGGTVGATFAPYQPLVEAGAMPPPATDAEGLRAVLAAAEKHVQDARAGNGDTLLLVIVASLPPQASSADVARLAALTHAGPQARAHLVFCGYPPRNAYPAPPTVEQTAQLTVADGTGTLGNPAGESYGEAGLNAPIRLDPGPASAVLDHVCRELAATQRAANVLRFADLVPAAPWEESSAAGLRTAVGRADRQAMELAFDDATPHWLVGGRTGSGKTVFLLNVLYGLAARYSPDELSLYLLDFKEGVSFTEFTPTELDPSWIPHAKAVGIESDREYGVAVLRELVTEMSRRAVVLKRAGVTKLADLRARKADVAMPRILAVIDEFHVLFAGNDALARQAASLLEELARKGRSYGVHLILASQTAAGVEALYHKTESIFGQFPLRVALAGGGNVLDTLNHAADGLPIGAAVVNDAGGIPGHNTIVRFPNAHAEEEVLTQARQWMWHTRAPGSAPPAVFQGFAEQSIDDDPTYPTLKAGFRHRSVLVGRRIDVVSSTARFGLDATPGRHLGVLGPSALGADILHAAAAGLARQHAPGAARFVVASLVSSASAVADATLDVVREASHAVEEVDAAGLRAELAKLAGDRADGPPHTYLIGFGMDAAAGVLAQPLPDNALVNGRTHLRQVLKDGPARGVHLLVWWRGIQRFTEDIGGPSMREDVACLVALNVAAQALGNHLGVAAMEWERRQNRALMIDLHDDRMETIVPFARPDQHGAGGGFR